MRARTTEVVTIDGPMPLYEAIADAPERAVIVSQEAAGVNSHIESVTRRFADAGYHAVAPHIYHRTGGGTLPYHDYEGALKHLAAMNDATVLVDVDATLSHLHGCGWEDGQIGIVGFCFGGRIALSVAIDRSLGGAVGFYGGGLIKPRVSGFAPLIDQAPKLQTPWLGFFGDLDTSIPAEEVEALRLGLQRAAAASDVIRYPDTDHGFHCDERESYQPVAAQDAWKRTLSWLEQHLLSRHEPGISEKTATRG